MENAFGILTSRWRIIDNKIIALPEHVDLIILATVALHNYLKSTDATTRPECRYVPPAFVDYEDDHGVFHAGQWRQMVPHPRTTPRQLAPLNPSQEAKIVREKLRNYFLTPDGQIPWQEKAALST